MYEILLERRAQRDLDALPPDIHRRVITAISRLRADPRPSGSRKLQGTRSDWRIRVGDYRVIYEIRDSRREVRVMYIRHRRDAYR